MKAKVIFFEINSYKLSDWYSYVIKFFTHSSNLTRNNFTCTHVGFVIDEILYEAIECGVINRKYNHEEELKTYKIREFEVDLTENGIKFLNNQLLCNYNYTGALLSASYRNSPILIKIFGNILGILTKIFHKPQYRWFCSQLVMTTLLLHAKNKNEIRDALISFIEKKYNKHPIFRQQGVLTLITQEYLPAFYISQYILPADIYIIFSKIKP